MKYCIISYKNGNYTAVENTMQNRLCYDNILYVLFDEQNNIIEKGVMKGYPPMNYKQIEIVAMQNSSRLSPQFKYFSGHRNSPGTKIIDNIGISTQAAFKVAKEYIRRSGYANPSSFTLHFVGRNTIA